MAIAAGGTVGGSIVISIAVKISVKFNIKCNNRVGPEDPKGNNQKDGTPDKETGDKSANTRKAKQKKNDGKNVKLTIEEISKAFSE